MLQRLLAASAFLACWVCAAPLASGQGFVVNGDFEESYSSCGKDDQCPDGWTLHETRDYESTTATPVADNGPSLPGSTAWDFDRYNGGASGDWTVIDQELDIDVTKLTCLELFMDVKVISHDLEAGGWSSPAWEWPVLVQVRFVDTDDVTQYWRFGWYVDPPGDSIGGPVDDPGMGSIPIYHDMEVTPDTWVANSFDLLAELPDVKTIEHIRVGGAGWNFHGRVDNVRIEPHSLLANGAFEGPSASCGNDDECPDGWTLHETSDHESSQATAVADNGPSLTGDTAWDFERSGGSSGDWTVIDQPLNLTVSGFTKLNLALDVKVISHDLEAGGWVSPAWEWPVMVQVSFIDTSDATQHWRFGWYLDPPGDAVFGPADDPGMGSIPIYNDMQVAPSVWVANEFDLLAELPSVKKITKIRVGGAGWSFHGRVDNVLLTGTGASLETVRLGAPPNPAAFLPGVTSGPVTGSIWDPVITPFVPSPAADFMALSAFSVNLPTPLGTLLIQIPSPSLVFTSAPGVPFAVSIPDDCGLVGLALYSQGLELGVSGQIALANAIDFVIGAF